MANQVIVGALFQEGTSQVRPPYFNGQHFSHWKIRMEIFTKAYDVKVWRVIKKGNYPLPANTPPLADPDDIDSYSKEKLEAVQINHKARNLLHNAISGEEYEKISSCDTAKEMWDKLEVTYEDTSKTHLKKTNQEEKKKTVVFKATTESAENEIDDPEVLQKEIAMMSINIDGLMRRYRNTNKGRFPPRRSRQYNEQDKNNGKCYECGKFGHIQAECPELKRKISRGFNKNRSFGSWSDEDDSDHEEIANLCFMTILENEINKTLGCWTEEDDSDNKNCFMAKGETSEIRSYDCKRCNELQDILDSTLKESQKMMNELKRLTREVKDWKLKHEVCEIEKDVLQEEFEELQMQFNNLRKSTSHSSVRSNQMTYKSTGKEQIRTRSTSRSNQSTYKSIGKELANPMIANSYSYERPENMNTPRVKRKGNWYLDSVCSSHMTGDKSLFKEVIKIGGGSVKFGDDSRGKIVGTRTIPFNNSCDITEVYLVDGLNYNLLSISQLYDSGYEVKFKNTRCATEDESGKIILPGKRYENVYILDGFENIDGHICLTSMSDDPWLWHRRLGHASMHLIEKLSKQDLVIGLPKLNFSRTHICDACQMGKQTRNSFKNKDTVSTSKPLQLLHTDLFGPTRTASIRGKKYVFVIVDDFSRFTWVILLSHKNEALRNFEVFCKMIEREKVYPISIIQSDHGDKFESKALEDFCNDQGYTHNFSAPRSPQQNGVMERKK
ncbi:uncharacterized protein LOC142165027 [Nicotiana tabacum]|uniref:Uncharacterized protein LOC142165027 n=1 Tax=Nicotiana tabacum TaxID=4097 RepID=A0AC58S470_TOBAC